MVRTEHTILELVRRAKQDAQAADRFIQQYMGFIRSETMKFTHAAPEQGHEDELSLAMLAFYEAVLGYETGKGAFIPYAARAIKNRLIDHFRVEKRHGNVISLHLPIGTEEDGQLMDTLPEQRNTLDEQTLRAANRQEIAEFGRQLAALGISFSEVADNCPRQTRTLAACRRVLDYGRSNPALLARLVQSGRLPMNELAQGTGIDKKTLERHRKYLVAGLLAFTNGYEIIRGHLCQIGSVKGGAAM